jgi:PD-(D/E)XK nuclease superfamily protein
LLYQLSYSGNGGLNPSGAVRCVCNADNVEHPKDIGDRSTLAIMLALREAGYGIYLPFGENTRCDLLIENDDGIARVQCKTGRLRKGAIVFAVCSTYGHHRNPVTARRTYTGEVDYFAVYCPETTRAYLVPLRDVPTRASAALRVAPARNSQRRNIRLAAPYEIGTAA